MGFEAGHKGGRLMSNLATMASMIALPLRWNSNRTLIQSDAGDWTGEAIESQSRRLAHALTRIGIRPGHTVTLIRENSGR